MPETTVTDRGYLTKEQEMSLKAALHFMGIAAEHEQKKEEYNGQANSFLLNLYESSDDITLKVLSDLIGKSSTAVDKRLKQARG